MNFTDYEKAIINKILELDKERKLNVLGNILEERFEKEHGYYIDVKDETTFGIYIRKIYMENLSKEYGIHGVKYLIEILQDELLKLAHLFVKLEHEGYIIVSGNFDEEFLGIKYESIDADYIPYFQVDNETKDLLLRFSHKRITPDNSLKMLVKNRYLSEEEKRYENQMRATRYGLFFNAFAVIISMVALILSITQSQHVTLDNNEISIRNKEEDQIRLIVDEAIIEKAKKELIEHSDVYIKK